MVVKNAASDATESYIQSRRKSTRTASTKENGGYTDRQFLLALPNSAKQLFNTEKHILRSIHNRIPQITFKAILFFKMSRSFWDIIMVAKGMKVSNVRGTGRYDELLYNREWEYVDSIGGKLVSR